MKKLKSALAASAAIAALLGIAGCGSNNASQKSAPQKTEDVKLTVWSPQEDQVDASSWLPTMEKEFEKAHPEYKITWKNSVVSEADAAKTVKQDPSSAADVYMFANDQLGTLIQAGAIGQLSDDALAQVKKQNSDVLVQSVTGQDGNVYGVPYTGNTWFMYYNKSVFSKEDVTSLDAMLAKGKVAFPVSNSWNLPAFYVGAGATIFGEKGNDAKAGVKLSNNAADVTKYLVSMVHNTNFVNDADGAGLAGLANGTVDAIFSGSWDAANVKKALGDKYAVAIPPTFTLYDKKVQLKAFAGSKAVGYNPNTKYPEAAAKFAAFLGSTEAQKAHYTMRQIVPSDMSLAKDQAIANDPMSLAQLNTIEKASIVQPTIPAMTDFWEPCQTFGTAILNGDVNPGNAAQKTAAWVSAYNK